MNPVFRSLKHVFVLWMMLLSAITISVLLDKNAPRMEGYVFPVTGLASITRSEVVSESVTRVWLSREKIRNCRYVDMRWFVGTRAPGQSIEVPVVYESPLDHLPLGMAEVGPWLISTSEYQVMNNTYAYVTHDCHLLWDTESLIYDSQLSDSGFVTTE